MCGRFTLTVDPEQLAVAFSLTTVPDFGPRYNIAPTQQALVITADQPREAQFMRWGLIPSWSKDAAISAKLINARGETLAEKPSFRSAFEHRRCLIPADSFYEWMSLPAGKQPVRILLKSEEPFALAGLWSRWTDPARAVEVRTCTIVTTEPNALLQPVHDRMPVILTAAGEDQWLAPGYNRSALAELLRPYPANEMTYYPVSPRLNSGRVEDADLIRPLAAGPAAPPCR